MPDPQRVPRNPLGPNRPRPRSLRRPRSTSSARTLLVIGLLAAVIIGGVGVMVWSHNRRETAAMPFDLGSRTSSLLKAWQNGTSHPDQVGGIQLYSVADWTVLETHEHPSGRAAIVLVQVDSSTQGGMPIRKTWAFLWGVTKGRRDWQMHDMFDANGMDIPAMMAFVREY